MLKKLLRHPWLVIAVISAITVFFGLQLPKIEMDNDSREFLPHQHASYQRLLDSEATFGSINVIGASLEDPEQTILKPENITLVSRLTDALENIDGVTEVTSLTNIDYIQCDENGTVTASPMVSDDFSGARREMQEIYSRIFDWETMYDRVIISDDEHATQMQITIDTSVDTKGKEAILREVRATIDKTIEGTNLIPTVYGEVVLSDNSRQFMTSDLSRLIPLVALVVLATLFFSFKTLEGTFLPLATVLISTIWACGLMSAFHITFTLVSTILPVALIGVGSAYGIHVLTHYYMALDKLEGQEITREKHTEAIMSGVDECFVAVLLAGITTMAGFISLITSPLEPLHSFAVFSSFGVAVALVLSITFIPAILILKPKSRIGKKSRLIAKLSERLKQEQNLRLMAEGTPTTQYNIYRFFAGTKPRWIVTCLAISIASLFGIKKLQVDMSLVGYYPPDAQVRKDLDYVGERFAGTDTMYFIVKGEERGSMNNPEILVAMDELETEIQENFPDVGKIVSFTTFIKRVNQVMHSPDSFVAESAASADFGDFGGIDDDFGNIDDDFAEIDDDFGDIDADFGDDFASIDDDFGEVAQDSSAETEGESERTSPYIDPNIKYSEYLNRDMSLSDWLSCWTMAYAASGGKDASVKDVYDNLLKELNYRGKAFHEIPYDIEKYPVERRSELKQVIRDYMNMITDSVDRFADDPQEPQSIRTQVQLRSHNTQSVQKIMDFAEEFAAKHFPKGYTIEATGILELQQVMTNLIVDSQTKSLCFSLFCVFLILTFSFKSPFAGIIGAVPLALTILVNYMVMGFAKINLDLCTSIIASTAIGVGIDYTIHFMETYRAERKLCADLETVTRKTFAKSGNAILTNALSVGLGFSVLLFSEFMVLRYIGVLVAIVMFTSSVFALVIIPGILNSFDPPFMHPEDRGR